MLLGFTIHDYLTGPMENFRLKSQISLTIAYELYITRE